MSKTKSPVESRASMTLKKPYKVSLEQTAAAITLETGEHVPATEVLYTLIDLHLEDAKKRLIKKYS
ncbi:MAG: hypothetical protein ISP86_01800 [Shewanellaceae bacterium]|nr:hypothetical protein [Shewanellaceae bacterium]